MHYLLDTHALIWWWMNSPRLSVAARKTLSDSSNVMFVSTASIYEIALKSGLGKLPEIEDPARDYRPLMERNGFVSLPISDVHAMKAGLLEGTHRDPFDRLIAAQGIVEGIPVITCDPALASLGCAVLW